MNYAYDTSLQETMILTEAFHTDRVICDNGSLYKFIWVQEGKLTLIVDHVEIEMEQDEIISVSNLHRTEFKNVSGRYLALLFNENFYGIYKHEKEVSIIRKSKFPQNPKRSVRFSGKGTKRSVQKRKARNTQKAETKVL